MPNWVQSLWIATWTRIRLPLSFVVVKIWPSISGPRKKEIKLVYILMMIIEKKNCCWKLTCFKENMNSSKKSKFKNQPPKLVIFGLSDKADPKWL